MVSERVYTWYMHVTCDLHVRTCDLHNYVIKCDNTCDLTCDFIRD